MGTISAALMCHAPIVIPEIAGPRGSECKNSTEGMKKAAKFLVDSNPDGLIVLSPHTPRLPDEFTMVTQKLSGDFSSFGCPDICIELPSHVELEKELDDQSQNQGIPIRNLGPIPLDHGASVPLYFLKETGWKGPTLVIGFPVEPTHGQCRQLGEILRNVLSRLDGNWSICVSGDMSHRLKPDAPAGFDPRAHEFDQWICENVRGGDFKKSVEVDESLRYLAGEDVVDSLEIGASLANFRNDSHAFYSYECPFGVGYLVSALYRISIEDLK